MEAESNMYKWRREREREREKWNHRVGHCGGAIAKSHGCTSADSSANSRRCGMIIESVPRSVAWDDTKAQVGVNGSYVRVQGDSGGDTQNKRKQTNIIFHPVYVVSS